MVESKIFARMVFLISVLALVSCNGSDQLRIGKCIDLAEQGGGGPGATLIDNSLSVFIYDNSIDKESPVSKSLYVSYGEKHLHQEVCRVDEDHFVFKKTPMRLTDPSLSPKDYTMMFSYRYKAALREPGLVASTAEFELLDAEFKGMKITKPELVEIINGKRRFPWSGLLVPDPKQVPTLEIDSMSTALIRTH